LVALLTSIASAIISSVIGKINVMAGSLVSMVLSILIGFFMIIFNFGLYRMLESQFRPQQ
jgi:hypothetical protein